MPELATAWVTLTVSGQHLRRDIQKVLNEAERGAKIAPKVDTGRMGADASSAGRNFGSRFSAAAKLDPRVNTAGIQQQADSAGRGFGERFSSAAKGALALGGVGLGLAGLAAQFKQVMSVGMDWTNNMNTLSAVTGASADQLKKAGDAARALGNDVSLPATSANDAASAMTELAKGGFTVQQAMDAAKGSLQLAAAAQISATDAATIQSQALQSFGLQARDAGKMSDILANAANASSAEITDVAQALQQSGTVANQFGVSAEDTASAIALLANNGIKGSDAGTLLKSTLLALTDQGKPAQGAIQDLGLTVYDAQGKFVGLHSLMGQLGDAAKRMTNEEYQAATATLFGSDAMRFAGVAAKDGAQSYDAMRVAIDRQGAAADVAAAKTKGLPGAWERFKNTVESLQLQAYDKLEGPLTKLIDGVAQVPDKLSELAKNPQVQSLIEETKSAFAALADSVKSAGPALGQIGKSLATAAGAVGGAAWKAFVTVLESAAAAVRIITPALKVIGDLMAAHQGLVTTAVAAWAGFKLIPGIMGNVTPVLKGVNDSVTTIGQKFATAGGGVKNFADAYRTSLGWVRQANPDISTAAAHLSVVGTNARAAAGGGMSLIKGAAAGVMGAFGGPFGLALAGAGVAFSAVASNSAGAKQAMDEYRTAVENSATAQQNLNDALLASGGAFDAAAIAKSRDRVQTVVDQFKERAEAKPSWADQIAHPEQARQQSQEANSAKAAADAIANLHLTNEQLTAQVINSQPIFDELVQKLQAQGEGGAVAAENLTKVREQILGMADSAKAANPVLKRIGEDTATAAKQIKDAFASVPENKPINVDMPGGKPVLDLLIQMGAAVSEDNDKNIHVDAPLAPEITDALEKLNIKVRTDNDKLIIVKADTTQAKTEITDLTKPEEKVVTVRTQNIVRAPDGLEGLTKSGVGSTPGIAGKLFGGIVPMASGGLRWITKPSSADIYQGRGAGTIFAEEATGGEAYIPLAPSKRPRSMAILMEVARLFGLNSNAEGSITVDQLKSFASGISGNSYAWGAGNGDTFATDCSGAQATIANMITGANGRFSTADEAQALLARGFQQGDPPAGIAAYWVGWKNGGPGGGHTAGTIVDPEGGNVNVEMGGRGGNGQYGGSAAGASEFPNRAWIALAGYGDDPSKTGGGATSARVMSAQASVRRTTAATAAAQKDLDAANAEIASAPDEKKRKAAEKKRDAAQRRLDSATDQQAVAEQRLAEVKDKEAAKTDKAASDGGAQGFGQSLVSGLLQGIGLDGSVFSNPLEWPNVKSALALVNWGGGLAKAWASADGQDPSGDGGMTGGALNGIGLPNVADFLKPIPPGSTTPIARPDEAHAGSGAAPGPTYDLRGAQLGVSPTEFTQKLDARQNSATRRQGFA